MPNQDCLFCQIAAGQAPAHKFWESPTHLAFLSIYPNTQGFSVVIPKKHYGSYAFTQADKVLSDLIVATKQVAQILDHHFADVSRCGMFFEGYGVDHLHSKLFPMHGTGQIDNWRMMESQSFDKFFEVYPGYLSSNNPHRASDTQLAKLAQSIRQSYQ